MKYIGIVGSRTRYFMVDYHLVYRTFNRLYELNDRIVSGGCPKGGDKFAEVIAKDKGIPILIFYPNWTKDGKCAGFVRNTYIADTADVLIACVSWDRKGGTEDTIKKFLKSHSESNLYLL